ncbi:MAG: hypothetical protein QM709_01515 [Spongiibacteraceae bacterium]
MARSINAALLSALVFPGAGHLYLRSYMRGIVLAVISVVALADFIRRAWHEADIIRDQLLAEINAGGVIDLEYLITQATNAVNHIDRQPFALAGYVLLGCWIAGVVDSYRIGKKIEESSSAS